MKFKYHDLPVNQFNPFLHTYSFQLTEEKSFMKTLWKKVKLLKLSNFTFFHIVFYAICILKSFNSHSLDVVCSFFEFGTVSKWCIREWVYGQRSAKHVKINNREWSVSGIIQIPKKEIVMHARYPFVPIIHCYSNPKKTFQNF